MTIEEAIRQLKIQTDYAYDEDLEALEMAISALEDKKNASVTISSEEWVYNPQKRGGAE